MELATDTCLVSETINAFMNMGRSPTDDRDTVFGRFLQDPSGNTRLLAKGSASDVDDECAAPEITSEDLTALMNTVNDECEAPASEEDFNATLDAFLQIFANEECWGVMCTEDFSKLFFSILFDEAASCAGVELDVPPCVKDHIIDLVLFVEDPTAGRVRRMLQEEESDPCDTPNKEDLDFFIEFILIDAEAACVDDVPLIDVDWNKTRGDLVAIFSSPECWGVGGCSEEESFVDTSSESSNEKDEDPISNDTETTISQLNEAPEDSTDINATIFIASAGGLVAMALLITGFRKMNQDKQERHVQLVEKSNDGESTANKTADVTFANSCDHSDISSIPSPARSLTGMSSPSSARDASPEVTRFFVLAEEEEQNWRDLSILPALAQDDGTLEGVSEEEGSFAGSVSTRSSQAIDEIEV